MHITDNPTRASTPDIGVSTNVQRGEATNKASQKAPGHKRCGFEIHVATILTLMSTDAGADQDSTSVVDRHWFSHS
eukprot:scaffold131_cov154-Amphora_coffeaeformis.AAC.2